MITTWPSAVSSRSTYGSQMSPAVLPPYFTLRVPSFGVAAKVKRVWVAMPTQGSVWCGGIIEKQNAKQTTNWQTFIANAPNTGQKILLEASGGI